MYSSNRIRLSLPLTRFHPAARRGDLPVIQRETHSLNPPQRLTEAGGASQPMSMLRRGRTYRTTDLNKKCSGHLCVSNPTVRRKLQHVCPVNSSPSWVLAPQTLAYHWSVTDRRSAEVTWMKMMFAQGGSAVSPWKTVSASGPRYFCDKDLRLSFDSAPSGRAQIYVLGWQSLRDLSNGANFIFVFVFLYSFRSPIAVFFLLPSV